MIDDDADIETLRQFYSRTPEEIEEKKRQKWNEEWNALRMPEHLARVADQPPGRPQPSPAHRWVKGRWQTAPKIDSLDEYQRALNDTIAGMEAPDYDILYSPRKGEFRRIKKGPDGLPDYSRHPGDPAEISFGPNQGDTSSAAGRYQFLSGTWRSLAGRHEDLSTFDPLPQDKGAWYLAAEVYGHKTGRDLRADLRDPRQYPAVAAVLNSQWTSLPGGAEQRPTQAEFDRRMSEALQRHRSGAPGAR